MRMKKQDEEEGRLLKVTRACGWLSYQADPVSKTLVRTDEQDWYKGREAELLEDSHRHPKSWWDDRYKWKDGEEPLRPDFKKCGHNIFGLEYMRDEFPENEPHAEHKLKCMAQLKAVRNHDVDLIEGDLVFAEAGSELIPENFLKTQRERYEETKLRAILSQSKPEKKVRKVSNKMKRERMRKKLRRRAKKEALKSFLKEVTERKAEGYSVRQLLQSHIPEIGCEVKVSEADVSAALKDNEAKASTKFGGGLR